MKICKFPPSPLTYLSSSLIHFTSSLEGISSKIKNNINNNYSKTNLPPPPLFHFRKLRTRMSKKFTHENVP